MQEIKKQDLAKESTVAKEEKQIVVYNDDVNSFEHVIMCFIQYCNHEFTQAEQCALIIHNNGKCSVKKGDYKRLKPILEALTENGISAEIQ